MAKYSAFIKDKLRVDTPVGFDVAEINDVLFPFQKVIVKWALCRGRAAIFADTGLGKTLMQAEWAKHVHQHTNKPVLILAPLCVAKQTVEESKKINVIVNYCRDQSAIAPGINITNYEMLDHFDPACFSGIVLDESSILKNKDGSTRSKIIASFQNTPYRLACTATPSPNDFMELGNHVEFLGLMSMREMLAMYFVHDGGSTSKWRLKGHGASKFWEWMATWCVVIRKPSDLGFDDAQYDLPELSIHQHIINTEAPVGELFKTPAATLMDRRRAKRDSIGVRVAAVAELCNNDKGHWLVWCHLNDESDMASASIHGAVSIHGADSINDKEQRINQFTSGGIRVLVTKPSIAGHGMNWQHINKMVFVGLDDSFESYYQAIRRCWRFGQSLAVDVHVFLSDREVAVLDNIKRKETQHYQMSSAMVSHMKDAMHREIFSAKSEKTEYAPANNMRIPTWLK